MPPRPTPLPRPKMRPRRSRSFYVLCFITLVALGVDRGRLLADFSFRFVDHDQVTLWHVASDLLRGHFREPCFPGQSYNPAIEGWLAAPLVASGLPYHIAFPLVTVTLALFPFMLLAGICLYRGLERAALAVLLLPLVLPVEYAAITSLPRGFVTGLALAAPVVVICLFSSSSTAFFAAGALSVLSLTANPNVAPLLAPLLLFAILTHWRSATVLLSGALGALSGSVVPLIIRRFYSVHPEYDYHRKAPLAFTWETLANAVRDLDSRLGHLLPFDNVLLILPALLVLAVLCLVRARQDEEAASVVFGVLCLVLSLGINRTEQGVTSVYHSYGRMFLALPVFLAVILVWLDSALPRLRGSMGRRVVGSVFLLVLIVLTVQRQVSFGTSVSTFVEPNGRVHVQALSELRGQVEFLERAAQQTSASLVLFGSYDDLARNYAVPVLTDHRLETLFPPAERRTWRLVEESRSNRRLILFSSEGGGPGQIDRAERFYDAELVLGTPPTYLLKIGDSSVLEVARKLQIPVRRFRTAKPRRAARDRL